MSALWTLEPEIIMSIWKSTFFAFLGWGLVFNIPRSGAMTSEICRQGIGLNCLGSGVGTLFLLGLSCCCILYSVAKEIRVGVDAFLNRHRAKKDRLILIGTVVSSGLFWHTQLLAVEVCRTTQTFVCVDYIGGVVAFGLLALAGVVFLFLSVTRWYIQLPHRGNEKPDLLFYEG